MGCLRFLTWVACIEVSLKEVGGTPKGSRHASSHRQSLDKLFHIGKLWINYFYVSVAICGGKERRKRECRLLCVW